MILLMGKFFVNLSFDGYRDGSIRSSTAVPPGVTRFMVLCPIKLHLYSCASSAVYPTTLHIFCCIYNIVSILNILWLYINHHAYPLPYILTSLPTDTILLRVLYWYPHQQISPLPPLPATIYIITHILIPHNYYPRYMINILCHFIHCPSSISPPYTLSQTFTQSCILSTIWYAIIIATIQPPFYHTKHPQFQHHIVYDIPR